MKRLKFSIGMLVMACTLMLMPHKAVNTKQITRAALISVCAILRGVYLPLNSTVYHFLFSI